MESAHYVLAVRVDASGLMADPAMAGAYEAIVAVLATNPDSVVGTCVIGGERAPVTNAIVMAMMERMRDEIAMLNGDD